ncbi:alpha/beta hydrolase [Catenuloplanes japonicus]|uniref:alpha/beta hydrolase n=1 Tax=Catenuloplanes japonicus TaxID=33876 RepID=UPI0005265B71|nr:alpha/beta hydrolase [Catenuloplanes japonicus]
MPVTYELLWQASPPAWRQSAAAWRELAASGARRALELASGAVALAAAWSGAGADAAVSRLRRLRDELEAGRLAQLETAGILVEYAAAIETAKARLAAAVRAAETAGLAVDRSGLVVAAGPVPGSLAVGAASPDGMATPTGLPDSARAVAGEIEAALAAARVADTEAATRLGELSRAADSGWESTPPGYRPGPAATPAANRAWWDSLTPAQRRWLLRHEPTLTGGLDGLPVAARDLANRVLLDLALEAARLGLPVDGFRSGGPSTGVSLSSADLRGGLPAGSAYARDPALIASLERLADQVSPGTEPPRYLVRFDPSRDGRAVVAVGDPDRSEAVVTCVPGMTSDLASFGGELDRAARVAEHATELDPARRTAAVLWLDYDAPDFVVEAASEQQARDAAPALHRFQEGLRAGHEGEPARQTVLGHSYGSLVAGVTARDHGLDADGLVLLASPGAGVSHAADLGLPEVWAGTSITDPIQRVPVSPISALTDAVVASGVPGLGPALAFGQPEDGLWLGRNPADPDFGARVFATEADAGHLGYWDRGGTALDTLSRITLGLGPS